MGVSAGGGPTESSSGLDPDEVRAMFVPHWVAEKALRGVQPLGAIRRIETRIYEMVHDRFLFIVDAEQSAQREQPVPRWLQFAACDALVESRAHDMAGRYADVARVLDALRDDEGLCDAVKAACRLGAAPAVRQFVAGTFFAEAQDGGT